MASNCGQKNIDKTSTFLRDSQDETRGNDNNKSSKGNELQTCVRQFVDSRDLASQ